MTTKSREGFYDEVIETSHLEAEFKLKKPAADSEVMASEDARYWACIEEGRPVLRVSDSDEGQRYAIEKTIEQCAFLAAKFALMTRRPGVSRDLQQLIYQAEAIDHLMWEVEKVLPTWRDKNAICDFYAIWANLFDAYLSALDAKFNRHISYYTEYTYGIDRFANCITLISTNAESAESIKPSVREHACTAAERLDRLKDNMDACIRQGLEIRSRWKALREQGLLLPKSPLKPAISTKTAIFRGACDVQEKVDELGKKYSAPMRELSTISAVSPGTALAFAVPPTPARATESSASIEA